MEPRVKEPIPLPTYTRWTRRAYVGRVTTSSSPALPVARVTLFAFLGGPNGVAPSGFAGMSFKAPSAQLQTDFQTLQSDEKALQAEIPASLTAAVKADQAVIQKAFSSLTPTQLKALHPVGRRAEPPAAIPRPT